MGKAGKQKVGKGVTELAQGILRWVPWLETDVNSPGTPGWVSQAEETDSGQSSEDRPQTVRRPQANLPIEIHGISQAKASFPLVWPEGVFFKLHVQSIQKGKTAAFFCWSRLTLQKVWKQAR